MDGLVADTVRPYKGPAALQEKGKGGDGSDARHGCAAVALSWRRRRRRQEGQVPADRNLTFDHTKRTTFDRGADVRARVRFRMEGKYPVAWLDDLHSLHPHHFRGKGDQQGLWQLPGGAPYATSTSMHEYVGGVKIWRVEDDTFRIKFYGPRSRLPFGRRARGVRRLRRGARGQRHQVGPQDVEAPRLQAAPRSPSRAT